MSAHGEPARRCRRLGDAAPVQGPGNADATPDLRDVESARVSHDAWQRATEAQRAQAAHRLDAVRHAEELVAIGIPRLDADRTAAAEAGVAAAAVGAWRRKVKGLPKGGRIGALLDAPRTGRPPKIEGAMREDLEALACHFGDHLTATHARRTLVTHHGHAPAVSTIKHWIARYRQDNARDLSAVTNPDRHRSHRKPAGGDAAAHIERLNQEWELDSTLADVICADGKRHAIVSCIDIWGRRARILVVPTSRATAIAALLRRCILEWGVPELVRTDEGADYTSEHVVGVIKALELVLETCPPYTPEAKPFVERFLGTLARDLFAFLPGFAGHDVAQAQALRSRKSFASRRAERAQNRKRAFGTTRGEDACKTFGVALTAEELQAHCDDWCRAIYERAPHAGLDGASPFDRARSWTGPVPKVCDVHALDALLAEPAGGGWRTVGKKGIRLDNVDYIAGPLGGLTGERVQVRHDPADLDRIHVYDKDGSFVCLAEDPGRTGADRAAIAAAMKGDHSKRDRAARARARELAKRHQPARSMVDVLAHATRAADRVVALPRRGDAHETPALTEAARAAKAADKADEIKTATERPVQSKVMAGARRLFLEEE